MPSPLSDRATRARIAAHERWAREPDRSAATAAARAANDDRYLRAARELHPTLPEEELRVRAANLRSADMGRIARARWGGQRVVRLDALAPAERALVLALVEAARKGKAP